MLAHSFLSLIRCNVDLPRPRAGRRSAHRRREREFEALEPRQMLAGDVVISEILAANGNGVRDAQGNASDWIEIHNQGAEPVELGGWYLTDQSNFLPNWRFPARTLAPDEYLVVFATGEGGVFGSELHTTFRLSTGGEYLALVKPDRTTIASEFQPAYPPQVVDVSFGRDASGTQLYYPAPTPGTANGPGQSQFSPGVYISEFMAVNHATLADSDGDYADWIEIHNAGPAAVNLNEWTLGDDEDWLDRWEFPSVTIESGAYLVVFASGNDRRDPADELHTNFKLSSFGEYLALVDPQGTVVSDYQNIAEHVSDVSFGLSPDRRQSRSFSEPTPGAANAQERLRIAFDHARGFYDAPFPLVLTADTAGATIRYTLDGSEPTVTNGQDYLGPVAVSGTTTFRAAAFLAGERGPVFTQTYLFIADVLSQSGAGQPNTWGFVTDYEVDSEITTNPQYSGAIHSALRAIPSVSLVVDPANLFGITDGIYANPMMDGPHFEPAASLEWLDEVGGAFGNAQHDAELRIEHSTGSVMPPDTPKLSFRAIFGNGANDGAQLPVGDDERRLDALVLDAGYEDSWLHPDGFLRLSAIYGRDEWFRQTQAAMDQPALAGSFVHLYVNGLYWGLYSAIEAPTAATAARQLGGSASDYDVIAPSGATAGDANAWNTLLGLVSADVSQRAAYERIREYLDLVNLADFAILNRFASQRASDAQGWFAVRRRGTNAAFRFWAWDAEETLGAECGVAPPASTLVLGPEYVFSRLSANAEFRQLVADRVNHHLGEGGALSSAAAIERLLELDLAEAMLGESARWGDYRRDAHPYSTTTTTGDPTPPGELFTLAHWQAERNRLSTALLPNCGEALVASLREANLFPPIDAPTLSQDGGAIDPGFTLSIDSAAGAVYYTLDGSDPRLPGGGLSPAALRYSTPIALDRSVRLTARSLSGATWSAASVATFLANVPPPIVVTEIMYHPAGPSDEEFAGGFVEDDAFEFIELKNVGAEVLALDELRFVRGISFAFAAGSVHTLSPGEHVVIVSDADAFAARYGGGYVIAGEYSGRLANGGEYIAVGGNLSNTILTYWFSDGDPLTDGPGFSLVTANEGEGYAWQRSAYQHGSPGEDDPYLAPGSVVINEVFASGAADWVELYNTTDENIEVGGWFLSDEPGNPTRSTIPAGLFVPAKGYLVLNEGVHFGFGLSRSGEQLSLASSRDGLLGGYRESATFERAETGVSFGRHVRSDGGSDFVRQQTTTPGALNAGPRSSPVAINEIMYHPAGDGDEYIELYNPTTESIALDGWRLTGVGYVFAPGTSIAAGEYVVVAPVEPGAFRQRNNVPAAVPVVGPYPIVLNNAGESVSLYMPDIGGEVRADFVVFDHEAPWSMLADGGGASLGRLSAAGFGNDAANWAASIPGGTPGAANMSISQAPRSIPYAESFEEDSLAALAGWSFAVTDGGVWSSNSIVEQPQSGMHHLRALQTGDGDTAQEATSALDLTGFVGVQNLALDFWTRRDRGPATSGVENRGVLEIRGATGTWSEVATLRPPTGRYTHYAFDLDAELVAAGLAGESQIQLRWKHFGEQAGDTLWLDDVRVSQFDFFGPNVIAQSPGGVVHGAVSEMTITFDDPIAAASFTANDVRLIGPSGQSIAVQSITPATSTLWRVAFASQTLPGDYRVTIGPDVTDTAGNPMNQGGATIDGQAIGSEPYRGAFSIAIPSAREFPVGEGFEQGTLGGLSGWSFGITETGTWEVTSAGTPHGGAYHLKSGQSGFGRTVKDAVMRFDLAGQSAGENLVLDFWATRQGHSSGNFGAIYASGDGAAWSQIYALSPELGEATYFVFDLGAALDGAGIARDSSVYLRFSHTGRFANDVMHWDDVRISDVDLFGPRVSSVTPVGLGSTSIRGLTVTFSEAIDASTLSAADVRVVGPTGYEIALAGPVVDQGDGLTFVLAFATPATLNGEYRVALGPNVHDLAGNALNQDGDPINGETNGHDVYGTVLSLDSTTTLSLPYTQDFEAGEVEALAGWSFGVSGSGKWSVAAGAGRDGGYALVATQTGDLSATQDAILALDIGAWPQASPMYLDLWTRRSDGTWWSNNETNVMVSADGEQWTWLAKLAPVSGDYAYFAVDLGAKLSQASIPRDGSLYVRFSHGSSSPNDAFYLDNLRLSDANPFGARVVAQTPFVETGDTGFFDVTFDRAVDPASFTAADISVTVPGSTAQVLDVTTTDGLTFRVSLAVPRLGGIYTLRIGPNVLRGDGVPMNQDNDTVSGEAEDVFVGSLLFAVRPQTLPYSQNFESGTLTSFAGWIFKAQGEYDWGGGDWKIVSHHNPYQGNYHVEATQLADCWTKHDAILALNLAGHVGATDLELDFYLQRRQEDERNMAKLLLSADGVHWTQVGTAAMLVADDGKVRFSDVDGDGTFDIAPPLNQYTQYRFDFDRLLAQAGLSAAATVYVDWHRLGFWKDSITTIDSISIRRLGTEPSPADLSGDGRVGLADMLILRRSWGVASGATRAQGDLTGDGAVSAADLAVFVRQLGQSSASSSGPAAVIARATRLGARDRALADLQANDETTASAARVLRARPARTPPTAEASTTSDSMTATSLRALRTRNAMRG